MTHITPAPSRREFLAALGFTALGTALPQNAFAAEQTGAVLTDSPRGLRATGSDLRVHSAEPGAAAGGLASRTRSQSPSPSALLPGGMKYRWPELGKGEPLIRENVPRLGSYHRAVTGPSQL